jgi:hypothetical protein
LEDLESLLEGFDVTADGEAAKGEPWVVLDRIVKPLIPDGVENRRVLIDRSCVCVKLNGGFVHWGDSCSLWAVITVLESFINVGCLKEVIGISGRGADAPSDCPPLFSCKLGSSHHSSFYRRHLVSLGLHYWAVLA